MESMTFKQYQRLQFHDPKTWEITCHPDCSNRVSFSGLRLAHMVHDYYCPIQGSAKEWIIQAHRRRLRISVEGWVSLGADWFKEKRLARNG